MFHRAALFTALPLALPLALLATPYALQAQRGCLTCGTEREAEPALEQWLPAPENRPEAKGDNNGNGKGGGNRGNGKGNGGNGGGDTGNDPVEGDPVEADPIDGCGGGSGGGSGNGTQGNGNGQACGDGSGNNGGGNGNGNNGNGNGNGGSNAAPDLFIQNEINFGRLILLGNGNSSVLLDLESGQKITAGNLDDYGGATMVGRATVTGRPNSEVQVSFPDRITMRDPRGGIAELREFKTSLPIVPRLDNTGTLEFSFTGKLTITETIGDGGDLRGRVPITVEYN